MNQGCSTWNRRAAGTGGPGRSPALTKRHTAPQGSSPSISSMGRPLGGTGRHPELLTGSPYTPLTSLRSTWPWRTTRSRCRRTELVLAAQRPGAPQVEPAGQPPHRRPERQVGRAVVRRWKAERGAVWFPAALVVGCGVLVGAVGGAGVWVDRRATWRPPNWVAGVGHQACVDCGRRCDPPRLSSQRRLLRSFRQGPGR
jgi:hypothetical protein